MKLALRRIALAWLLLGAVVFVHGAMTGSGLAGALLYQQLITSHDVSPSTVSELLFLPLCVAPLAILIVIARNSTSSPSLPAPEPDRPANLRRGILLGGLFGGAVALLLHRGRSANVRLITLIVLGVAAACLLTATLDLLQVGEPLDFKPAVNLDTDQAFPTVREATATGTLRTQFALAYEVTGSAKGVSYVHAVRLVPLTSQAWHADQPVRVLADVIETELPADGSRYTQRGFVSRDVPGYVRRAFLDQGVALDDNVVILRTAPDTNIDSLLLAVGVIALALGFVLAVANRSTGIPPPVR